jgi:hypothetical protein
VLFLSARLPWASYSGSFIAKREAFLLTSRDSRSHSSGPHLWKESLCHKNMEEEEEMKRKCFLFLNKCSITRMKTLHVSINHAECGIPWVLTRSR